MSQVQSQADPYRRTAIDPLVLLTAVSFRAAQFDAGTVAGVQWLLMVVFV
jgi:hypothetical protein